MRNCLDCKKPMSQYNKDPTCWACQAKANPPEDMPEDPPPAPIFKCGRGCSRPAHPGKCAKVPLPPATLHRPQPLTFEPKPRKEKKMDDLISKTILIEQIPVATAVRKPIGRLGELWDKLLRIKPGQAEEVVNRDSDHLTSTVSHLRKKAKKNGMDLHWSRRDTTLYLYLTKKQEAA